MSNNVLLTGATGFIGQQILKILTEANYTVRAVVRSLGKVKSFSVEHVEFIEVNDFFSCNNDDYLRLLKGIDIVIHCAWYVEPGKYLHSTENLHCLQGTLKFAQCALQSKIKRFIGLGTCFEYDTDKGYLTPETPLKPCSLYAATKMSAFECLTQLFKTSSIKFVWCRVFYLYGEAEDHRRLVPYLRSRLEIGEYAELSHGLQVRDFLDVVLAAQLIVDASFGPYQGAINICSGLPITVRQLAEMIADEYGRRDLLKFGVRPENSTDPDVIIGQPFTKVKHHHSS